MLKSGRRSSFWVIMGVLLAVCVGCSDSNTERDLDNHQAEREILEAEQEFNEYAARHGVKKAFLAFADDSAVIVRGGKLIRGKEEMEAYFDSLPYSNVKLSWEPVFVDAAKSGDLAYTYGKYRFSAEDSAGEVTELEGIFHTVWKRQPDGNWKFVYD